MLRYRFPVELKIESPSKHIYTSLFLIKVTRIQPTACSLAKKHFLIVTFLKILNKKFRRVISRSTCGNCLSIWTFRKFSRFNKWFTISLKICISHFMVELLFDKIDRTSDSFWCDSFRWGVLNLWSKIWSPI